MNFAANDTSIPSGPMEQFQIDDDSTSFEPVGMPYPNHNNSSMNQNQTPSFQNGAGAPAPINNAPTTWYQKIISCFQISTFQQYFDVSTVDVKNRIIASVFHANKPDYFRDHVLSNGETRKPDLYGPVWITMTLVFFLAVTSNTAKYLKTDSMQDFEYDIGHLTRAFSVLTFFTFALPGLLSVMFHFIGVELSLVDLVCIYGYSLTPYIPTTILCLVPSVFLEWMFLIIATVMSLMLVVRNVTGPVMRNAANWGGPVIMSILAAHFVFHLILKLMFYKHLFHGGSSSNSNSGGGSDSSGGGNGGDAPQNEDDGMQQQDDDAGDPTQ
jgi:hypothetical protein